LAGFVAVADDGDNPKQEDEFGAAHPINEMMIG
jgi:hypothetical protein